MNPCLTERAKLDSGVDGWMRYPMMLHGVHKSEGASDMYVLIT